MKNLNKYNLQKFTCIILVIVLICPLVNSQNEIKLKISESDITSVLSAVTNARGVNFGEYYGQYGLNAWYVNMNNASIDIKPNNQITFTTNIVIFGDIDVWLVTFGVTQGISAELSGEINLIGDNMDGYKFRFTPTNLSIDLSGLLGTIYDIVTLITGPLFVINIPTIEMNIGTSLLPGIVANYFKPGDPIFETTSSEIIFNLSVIADNIYVRNKLVNNNEQSFYEAIFHVSTDKYFIIRPNSSCNIVAGESITLLPGFIADYGSHFTASIDGSYKSTSFLANSFANDKMKMFTENSLYKVKEDYEIKTIDNKNQIVFELEKSDVIKTEDQITVYPNPTNGNLFVKINSGNLGNAVITIFDSKGIQIYNNPNPTEDNRIDLSQYNSGLYIVKVSSISGINSFKVMLQ